MFNIRNTRLLALALFTTCIFFYLGRNRPLSLHDLSDFDSAPPGGRVPGARPATPSGLHFQNPGPSDSNPPAINAGNDDSLEVGHASTATSINHDIEHHDDDADQGNNDTKRPPSAVLDSDEADDEVSKPVTCPIKFEDYLRSKPGPKSTGRRQFPLIRPPPECRTFTVPALEKYITRMETLIKDPDLYRLFQNSYPNTLDTMIKWHGFAQDDNGVDTDEELSYIITGDIDAMWLRDSASQLYSYLQFLSPDAPFGNDDIRSLNSLWRGLINSHSRYILISPYCHSFQPPRESGIPPTANGAYHQNNPQPPYNPTLVFDCKWELDSLASFLQVSVGYYQNTHDLAFFAKFDWISAVQAAVDAAAAMRLGTYDSSGRVLPSAWTFTGWTNRGSETLTNNGLGNPIKANGMVRTAFRPSDDATIFQFLVPTNMMWAKYLEEASVMMQELGDGIVKSINEDKRKMAKNLTATMREFARGIRQGIAKDAVVKHPTFGDIFAYECDGYGGVNLMDDANVPSLLAIPLFGYAHSRFDLPAGVDGDYAQIYQNTRKFVMSDANPYWAKGPQLSAVGGPHIGPGKAWPMAALVAAMTIFDEETGIVGVNGIGNTEQRVAQQLKMVLDSTTSMGVMHESVDSWNGLDYSRPWFGWANGLVGELISRIENWDAQRDKLNSSDGLLAWDFQ